jgi:hypothetical protein
VLPVFRVDGGEAKTMTYSELSYESILQAIYAWPAAKRFLLIQDLLKTIEPQEAEITRPDTLHQALGLLATDQPAPGDEAVTRWLNERRTEKYG